MSLKGIDLGKLYIERYEYLKRSRDGFSVDVDSAKVSTEDYECDFTEAGEGLSDINRDAETAKEKELKITKKYLEVTARFQYIVNPHEYVQCLIYQQNEDIKNGITYPFPDNEVIVKLRNELGL